MKYNIPLKYRHLDDIENSINSCQDTKIQQLLSDLKDLIFYQMKEIRDQRAEIIAIKHKTSWKRYDRSIEDYSKETRKYVDRPDSTDTMCC